MRTFLLEIRTLCRARWVTYWLGISINFEAQAFGKLNAMAHSIGYLLSGLFPLPAIAREGLTGVPRRL